MLLTQEKDLFVRINRMNNTEDLKVLINDTFLNIRVAILLETLSGFIFEKSKNGYLFALGGRVKLNETTRAAALRELFEELQLENLDIEMIAVVENFFTVDGGKKFHEINFVYKALFSESIDLNIFTSDHGNDGYIYVKAEDFDKHDIRPKIIGELFKNKKPFVHLTTCE